MAKIKRFGSQFAQVPNSLLQDSRLSFKARGLWAYMQSLPDDWDFSVERIATDRDGKDAVRSGLQELEALGYLSRSVRSVGTGGREAEYILKVPMAENPPLQKVAMAEKPTAENPPFDIGITKKQIPDKEEAQAPKRERRNAPSYESPELVPGFPSLSTNWSKIVFALYRLGWRWPKTKDVQSFQEQVRSVMVQSHMLVPADTESGFRLDETRFATELAKFTAYFEGKPTKNPYMALLNWFSRSK